MKKQLFLIASLLLTFGVHAQTIFERYANNDDVTLVSISPEFYRPSEVDLLIGDASKANKLLNWKPETTISELCKMMVEADLARNKE